MSDDTRRSPVKSGKNYITAGLLLVLALIFSKIDCAAASPLNIGLTERLTEMAQAVIQEDPASPPPVTITEGIQHPIRMISAEMDVWLLLASSRGYIRPFLPDGVVDAWLRARCATNATIDVSGVTRDDIMVISTPDGVALRVDLPEPVINFMGSDLEDWGFSSTWILNPSRAALELRNALRDSLPEEAVTRATEAGLREDARAYARDCLASVLHLLGIDDIEVRFQNESPITAVARRLEDQ